MKTDDKNACKCSFDTSHCKLVSGNSPSFGWQSWKIERCWLPFKHQGSIPWKCLPSTSYCLRTSHIPDITCHSDIPDFILPIPCFLPSSLLLFSVCFKGIIQFNRNFALQQWHMSTVSLLDKYCQLWSAFNLSECIAYETPPFLLSILLVCCSAFNLTFCDLIDRNYGWLSCKGAVSLSCLLPSSQFYTLWTGMSHVESTSLYLSICLLSFYQENFYSVAHGCAFRYYFTCISTHEMVLSKWTGDAL